MYHKFYYKSHKSTLIACTGDLKKQIGQIISATWEIMNK